MTGGAVVILGDVGDNFAAGMTEEWHLFMILKTNLKIM